MVFDFNYTVSSCSICVVHLFFSCVVVISGYRTHGSCVPAVTTSYNMISPVEILLKPMFIYLTSPNPQEIFFHGMNGSMKHVSTLPGFSDPFLVHFVTSRSQKCPNNMQLICMYKALISFSVISTNNMFLGMVVYIIGSYMASYLLDIFYIPDSISHVSFW